jgi:hypothetical protein
MTMRPPISCYYRGMYRSQFGLCRNSNPNTQPTAAMYLNLLTLFIGFLLTNRHGESNLPRLISLTKLYSYIILEMRRIHPVNDQNAKASCV